MKKIVGKTLDNKKIIAIKNIKNFSLIDETGEVVRLDGKMHNDTNIVYQESIATHKDYTVVGYINKSKYSVAGHIIDEVNETIDDLKYEYWSSYDCDDKKYTEIHTIFDINQEENPLELYARWYYVEIDDLYGLIVFNYYSDEPQLMMNEESEIIRALLYGLSEYMVDSISFIDLSVLDKAAEAEKIESIKNMKFTQKEIAKAIGVSEVTMSRADENRKSIYIDAFRWRKLN